MGVTLTAVELAEALGADQALADRLLPVAAAIVDGYAPHAPDALSNEATIRFAGYIGRTDYYGAVRSKTIGPLSVEYVTNHAAAFRNCGAAALLTRYKRRRAGSVGEPVPPGAPASPAPPAPPSDPAPSGGGFLRWGS